MSEIEAYFRQRQPPEEVQPEPEVNLSNSFDEVFTPPASPPSPSNSSRRDKILKEMQELDELLKKVDEELEKYPEPAPNKGDEGEKGAPTPSFFDVVNEQLNEQEDANNRQDGSGVGAYIGGGGGAAVAPKFVTTSPLASVPLARKLAAGVAGSFPGAKVGALVGEGLAHLYNQGTNNPNVQRNIETYGNAGGRPLPNIPLPGGLQIPVGDLATSVNSIGVPIAHGAVDTLKSLPLPKEMAQNTGAHLGVNQAHNLKRNLEAARSAPSKATAISEPGPEHKNWRNWFPDWMRGI